MLNINLTTFEKKTLYRGGNDEVELVDGVFPEAGGGDGVEDGHRKSMRIDFHF